MNKSIIILIFSLFAFSLSATIINIPEDYATIQEGIDASVDCDTVLVQPGTYFENIFYHGKNILVTSQYLFTNNDNDINNTVIDGSGIFRVITFDNGEDHTAVLNGFTITNGIIEGNCGGGIACLQASPSLMNLIITYNTAFYSFGGGGGLYLHISDASLFNVKLINNLVSPEGEEGYGGGLYCDLSSPILENIQVIDNYASGAGGCYFLQSTPQILNSKISNNLAEQTGGMTFCCCNSVLKNILVSENSSGFLGASISFYDESVAELTNVTIAGNSGAEGGIFCDNGIDLTLTNCCIWNEESYEIYFSPGFWNTIAISYTLIKQGIDGLVLNENVTLNWLSGNIDDDPLFVETGDHPYALMENSPCIDAGTSDTTGLNLPPWDLIGNHRIWDGNDDGSAIVDMGAYEYGAPPYTDAEDPVIPYTSFAIRNIKNYPNPFNPVSTISFELNKESEIELKVYNIKGQLVRKLLNSTIDSGHHEIEWDGTDNQNRKVSSGIYYYTLLINGKETLSRKMVVLK